MIELQVDPGRRNLGASEVGCVLPYARHRMVGPFIFFDHMGSVDLPKGLTRETDVRPHRHIGLSTVTYLFAGESMHRDSTGVEQAIRPRQQIGSQRLHESLARGRGRLAEAAGLRPG